MQGSNSLTVAQLLRKFSAFFYKKKKLLLVHKSPPLDPVVSQMNPVSQSGSICELHLPSIYSEIF
jgi:hypothetical protein